METATRALDDFLEELNRRIAKTEGREKQIGHSFLLESGAPITDADEFARRFRQEILPLLQEYCYDDYTALATYIGSKLVDKNAQRLDRERLADADALVAALEEEFGRREGGVVRNIRQVTDLFSKSPSGRPCRSTAKYSRHRISV